ncbi:hypothetical protein MMC28_001336 [Mycoblastus sanguinarius]|nr:hypothetical protein [Mycoblastus sanguinarius]
MLTLKSTVLPNDASAGDQAAVVLKKIKNFDAVANSCAFASFRTRFLPCPSNERKTQSLQERPFNLEIPIEETLQELGGGPDQPDTVFYIAYGSNLCAETFQGRRGIRPLSQVNVVVPELIMTFDLAGLPYVEPCFANTKYRKRATSSDSENSHLLHSKPDYHKNRWKKGLVGVVYEVTKKDFAHIIATEGGGASYQDVLVDCHVLPPDEDIVPEFPTTQSFKAHTLYSPILPPGEKPPEKGGRFSRPDPDYAQASARYLKLITDGADEHSLPGEYREYLQQLRAYTMTTSKQRLGGWIFATIWLPFITAAFSLDNLFADKKGRAPPWLVALTGAIFKGMWSSYDIFFSGLFGDGERTIYEDEDDEGEKVGMARRKSIASFVRYGAITEKESDTHQVV